MLAVPDIKYYGSYVSEMINHATVSCISFSCHVSLLFSEATIESNWSRSNQEGLCI